MTVLTTNRHTGYLYLLAKTSVPFLVLDGWDVSQRPLPSNVNLIGWGRFGDLSPASTVVIGHGLGDLFRLGLPCIRRGFRYVQVLHGRVERAQGIRRVAKHVIGHGLLGLLVRTRCLRIVFISDTVRASWGLSGMVIHPGIPVDELGPYDGKWSAVLIVGNDLQREHFDQGALLRVHSDLPLKVVGRNPRGPLAAQPAHNWDELRAHYAHHRAFINVLREPEDGYNLATLEAMGTGMPVLTLRHPTSPVQDGLNGLVADDGEGLVRRGRELLDDWTLARSLGANARRTVEERFAMRRFVADWRTVLEAA